MCKAKSGGGLGVKDIRAFNLSLLGKCRWRLLKGNSSLRRDVLVAKYEQDVRRTPLLSSLNPEGFASAWWKDIGLHGMSLGSDDDWW